MNSELIFACHRMPRADHYYVVRQTEGEPRVLSDLRQLNGCHGFAIAPFAVSASCPIVVIEGSISRCDFPRYEVRGSRCDFSGCEVRGTEADKAGYPFARFHEALRQGRFSKLVLARTERIPTDGPQDAERLFLTACHCYPRMFVTLFSTPQTGTWLMATPEVLIQTAPAGAFSTMALAGTMRLEGEQLKFDNPDRSGVQDIRWSQKNIQEQRLVATYIAEELKHFADDITEKGPYTTRAANLVHLRSDFSFVPKPGIGIGDIVAALHPTPAVCGLPKAEARDFILANEPAPRRYYSGFCGPIGVEGQTSLYVSLRCMELQPTHCQLYAGGGLLVDSVEEQEWQETEAKMQTMRRLTCEVLFPRYEI